MGYLLQQAPALRWLLPKPWEIVLFFSASLFLLRPGKVVLAVTRTTWKALQLAVSGVVLLAVKGAEDFRHSSFVFAIAPEECYPCRRMFHALFAFLGIFIPVCPCRLFSLVRWESHGLKKLPGFYRTQRVSFCRGTLVGPCCQREPSWATGVGNKSYLFCCLASGNSIF